MPLGDNIPAAVANAIQQGFLKEKFERALKGKRAYSMAASPEPVRARKGNTLTLTRNSGLAPKTTPVVQSAKNGDINNGLTPDVFSIEQYSLTMNEYMATADLNLMDDEVVIAKQALRYAEAQGDQAMSTLEILARNELFSAGMAGNSRVISNGSAPATTSCQVDDIRGFQFKLVAGKLTAVSGGNTLTVNEIAKDGSGVTQTLTVTGVVADVSNVSTCAATGGISGVITFSTATLPVVGDILIAANKSAMIRPNGRRATHLLTAQDVFTTGVAFDMSVILDNNGVPRFGDNYLCFVSPTSHRQLLADPAFEKAHQGQYNSDPMRKGVITEHQGILYVKTNFAIRQAVVPGAAAGTAPIAVDVERPIMVGVDALIEGQFEGLEDFVRQKSGSGIHDMQLIDGVIFNVRDALDRAGQTIAMTWDTIIDYAAPSDLGTTNLIVPTANDSLFKRIVVAEHAA